MQYHKSTAAKEKYMIVPYTKSFELSAPNVDKATALKIFIESPETPVATQKILVNLPSSEHAIATRVFYPIQLHVPNTKQRAKLI